MRKFKKRISVLLAVALMLGMFNSWSAYAGVLGDKLYGKSVVIGEEATLANGVYWNAGYTEKITENYIEYIPGGSVVPIISHGNDVHGAASFKAVASKAAMEGKTVVAGLNGDFFTMSNGVPDGVTIKDGLLITSESSGKPSVGFYPDGKIIIGRSNLNIRADGPNLGTGIGAIHLNKAVSKVSGVMLYTRDYGNDDTNKASIPTYNVLLRVDTEELHINGRVEAMVESVFSAVGSTTIPQGRVLLSLAAATEYPGTLTKLMALIPGDTLSLTFEGNSAWDNVNFAIGAGDKIVSGGKNVASASKDIHPRTAVGLKADGSAVFYTLDGRKAGHSKGATLSQLADRLIELGCTEAVNMDGGGSTAIHAVYPGDSDINTINSPSEGSLRNCANYILLVNTARPTGQLGNLHLYPYNPRMLAGSTQKFTVKGSDTNYYPVGVYLPLSFDAPENLGTFDNDGNFTAGKQGGKGEVMVFADGGVSGSTEVEIVAKPDSISILNQADKKTLTNISIKAGDKIDLTASSIYKRMPLHSSDRSYTWTLEGEIGTIDENGLFTASAIAGKSGSIKASAGGLTAGINVSIIRDGSQSVFLDMIGHWAENYTSFLYGRKVISGLETEEGLMFNPDRKITRAEFAVLVEKWLSSDGKAETKDKTDVELPFMDKDSIPSWALESVRAMYAKQVIMGTGTEKGVIFNPLGPISRQEVMAIIGRTQNVDDSEFDLSAFSDSGQISEWALPHVKALVKQKIVNGRNGQIYPLDSITRAEVATIIANMY